ncbi:MAG: membrane protein insertase YidC [Nitrospirota bacterium]
MERNAVLFLILSIAIIIGYSVLFPPAPPPPTGDGAQGQASSTSEPGSGGNAPAKAPPEAVAALPPAPSGTVAGAERTVVVETDLYRAALSTRGGVITSWRLARYTNGPENQTPIDLLTPPPAGGLGPLSVVVDGSDEEVRRTFQDGLFTLEGDDLRLTANHPTGTLRFEARAPGGAVLVKRLTFHHDEYLVDVEVTTWGLEGSYRLTLGENFGIREWGDATFVGYIGPSSLVDGRVIQDKPSKLEQPAVHPGRVSWTALQDKYFLTALIPASPIGTVVAERFAEKRLTIGLRETAPADGKPVAVRLYAGPKEYDRLAALQIGLQETIDFGWFIYGSWSLVRLIAEPLFLLLQFLHGFTGNYGVAIILLTTLIKTAFAPLSHKSFVSMKAMAALQPQTQALQKKYKHDKMRLNQELMSLYKTNKVNPLGGCLPMVVQIPFFIALFNILYTSIELRQAPFVGWISDLSVQDPYYVLPILMGVTMFVQQKMQPTTMDPRQAKIMLMLPIVFTFFFLAFPAGLVLYWMTNNILTILQQYVTLRYYKPQPLVIPKGLST